MNYLFFLLVIAAILLIINLFLGFYLFRLKKRIELIFKGKKAKDLEGVLADEIEKREKQEKEVKKILERTGRLEEISRKSFQKIGVIRFNPFGEMGGNQSFVVALLDNQDNGFVLSSLFTREGNRVFAKPIKKGESEYALSGEEKKAVSQAQSSQMTLL